MAETARVLMLAIRSSDYLIETDELDAAATILQNYLNAHPAHPQVLRRLGQVRLLNGQAKEAAALFLQALSVGEQATDEHGELAVTLAVEAEPPVIAAAPVEAEPPVIDAAPVELELSTPSLDVADKGPNDADSSDSSDADDLPEVALA